MESLEDLSKFFNSNDMRKTDKQWYFFKSYLGMYVDCPRECIHYLLNTFSWINHLQSIFILQCHQYQDVIANLVIKWSA